MVEYGLYFANKNEVKSPFVASQSDKSKRDCICVSRMRRMNARNWSIDRFQQLRWMRKRKKAQYVMVEYG